MINILSLPLIYWVVYGLVVALPIMVLTVTRVFKEDITVAGFILLTFVAVIPGTGFGISALIVMLYVFSKILNLPISSKILFKKVKK